MFRLKRYQEKGVNELKEKVDQLLQLEQNRICVFKSPTGSGKTIMMAEFIKKLTDNRNDYEQIAFIWITVHKLHDQSYDKLKKYYGDSPSIACSYFKNLQDRQIQHNEILFLNWPKVNKERNLYMKENEQDNNLPNIIKNTKDAGRKIILIIDESHDTAESENSKRIIDIIGPKITIEVSATPNIRTFDTVNIELEHVKNEGMIKKLIILNHDLGNVTNKTTDEVIINAAINKRNQIKEKYSKIGSSDINPLILIQLPNLNKGMLNKKDQIVHTLESKFKINIGNGKLAIHLANNEDKINLENITKNDNKTEVLIFKQALTVGWDCPRASILVLFRELKDITFSIQTIGRIMRMPEMKHYDEFELDTAYVYTNIEEVKIAEDVVKNYIAKYESKKKFVHESLELPSVYIKRQHEKDRLSGVFTKIFEHTSKKYELSSKISLKNKNVNNKILVEGKIKVLDKKQNVKGGVLELKSSPPEIQRKFDTFLSECTGGFAQTHSTKIIKTAVYSFFKKNISIYDLDEIQKIVLASKNINHFKITIEHAIEKYRKDVAEEITPNVQYIEKWEIPEHVHYVNVYKEEPKYKKCIMEPAYIKTEIKNEMKFMDYLEKSKNVKWWFKNEVNDKKYFAVEYIDQNDKQVHSFYVDFIIYTNDDRICLFDTKAGFTAQMAKSKAEGLYKYVKKIKNPKVIGGIAIIKNNQWMYNDNKLYKYDENSLLDWKLLKTIF